MVVSSSCSGPVHKGRSVVVRKQREREKSRVQVSSVSPQLPPFPSTGLCHSYLLACIH